MSTSPGTRVGDDAASFEVPKGSLAAGRRVRLPRGAEPPIRVYVNGVEQREGPDYRLGSGDIVFARPIVKEERLGFWRWASLWIGLVGTYRRNETVDVEYRLGGRAKLASDLSVSGD